MAATFLSPEIIVQERATQAVAERLSSSTTAAMAATATKGPIDRPQSCRTIEDFFAIYGKDDGGDGLEAALGFFLNGGVELLFNRVGATGVGWQRAGAKYQGVAIAPLSAEKTSGTGPFDLSELNIGNPIATLVAEIDGAGPDTATVQATPSVLTAAAVPGGLGVLGDTLEFTVGGVTHTYVVPAAPPTTATEWALSIQTQIPGVVASVAGGGEVVLTTEQQGSGADVDYVTSTGTAGAQSGFGAGPTSGVNAGPNDCVDKAAVTASELAAVIQAAWISGGGVVAVDSSGAVVVTTVATGAAASIGVVSGTAIAYVGFTPAGVANGVDAGGVGASLGTFVATSAGSWGNNLRYKIQHRNRVAATVTEDVSPAALAYDTLTVDSTAQLRVGLQILIEDAILGTTQRTVVTAITGPTTLTFDPKITGGLTAANNPTVTKETFDVTFEEVSPEGNISVLSTFTDVSNQITDTKYYFPDLLGQDPILMDPRDSVYVTGLNIPGVGPNTTQPLDYDSRGVDTVASPEFPSGYSNFEGGSEAAVTNSEYIGDAALKTGIYAFDKLTNFSMFTIPGLENQEVHRALMDYAESRKDFVAVMDSPEAFDDSPSQVVTYKNVTANLFGTFGYMSVPHVQIRRKSTGVVEDFPQGGFVMGAFARTDQVRNVSKPAAGVTDGQIRGILGLSASNPYSDKSNRDVVYPEGINPIVAKPGRGICIFGQNTLNPQSDRGAIGVRRAFIQIRKDLEIISEFVLFEQNTSVLRADYRKRVKAYLTNQRKNGVLQGSTDAEAYYVVCNGDNNPATVVNARRFVARIGLNIIPGVDFVEIEIERDTRALDAELSF